MFNTGEIRGRICKDKTLNEHLGCVEDTDERGVVDEKEDGRGGEGRGRDGTRRRPNRQQTSKRGARRRREGNPTQCGQRDENWQSRIKPTTMPRFLSSMR
ncbi:hypothetical protein K0M31_011333 [Melipona bicolor]|uniref:Uncharacterized protein n=1 Tax=Melipona bicolor TaxID=60889 RepID=A0AA40G9K1_9HYME|nr:hypothetical protein K0M31_011333 [Melipona bicolor]